MRTILIGCGSALISCAVTFRPDLGLWPSLAFAAVGGCLLLIVEP